MHRFASIGPTWDVIVLGAGPAGAVTAKMLAAEGCRVLLMDRPPKNGGWIGETLPPQASATLRSLGLMPDFQAAGHLPAPGVVSVWGDPEPVARDFLFSPYGNGWHLDRVAFNKMLVEAAASAGATILRNVVAQNCAYNGGSWCIQAVSEQDVQRTLSCRVLVDATGRSPGGLGRFPGRIASDRLIAVACLCSPPEGVAVSEYTLIEAVDEGWFYSALVPSGRWVLAYMTDADLYAAGTRRSPGFFASQLERAPQTRARIPRALGELSVFSARSSVRSRAADPGWCAVGDAARSLDPLSGQGILVAIKMAREAAACVRRVLDGDVAAIEEYDASNRRAFDEYRKMQNWYYGQEGRWSQSLFWSRRVMAGSA